MAVAFSALGTQNTVASGTTSVSHSHTIASAGSALIVAVHGDWNGNTNPSISASIGGTALTNIRQINNWFTRSVQSGGFYQSFAVFGIINPPTGAQTVTLTISNPGSVGTVLVQSASYTGVASFGTYTNNGVVNSAALTVTSGSVASGDMCFNAFFAVRNNASAALSGYNRTSRHNVVAAPFSSLGFLLGDADGAGSTIAFNATIAASGVRGGQGFTVPMVASVSGSNTDITPAAATITVTGTAPTLVTTTVLTPAAAAITVTGTAPKLENTVSPPGGSLTGALITITGTAPTLTMSLVTTGATITITGGTPSSAGEAILTPAAATIAVTGTAPTLLVSIVPGSETLPVTGGTPVLITTTVLSPAGATITITGSAPGLILPLTLSPAAVTITITGLAPSLTNAVPPQPTPTSQLSPTEFREISQVLDDRRVAAQSRKIPQPLIRLWDKDMKLIARITIPETWECEEIAHDNGMARIEIVGKDNDWLREILMFQTRPAEDLHITIDPDPAKPTDWKNRWGGKVETLVDEERQGKPTVTTITAVSNRIHLRHILMASMPVLPHAVQIPKMFLWGGPCVTACASAVFVNLFRIYTLNGWWPLPRNLFEPSRWFENASPLNWPVQVMPVAVLRDQSRWITISARWQDAETVLKPAMKDAGVICRAYTWLPGDPAPYEAFGPLKESLKPTRACVILSFEDHSGVNGPTGTAIDGLINLFAVTADDLFTELLFPVDGDGDGETDPFIRKILGVAPKRPPFVYRDTGYGGALARTTVVHKAKAITVVVGGRSPGWVNQAITFGIRYGLSQIAQAISSVPGAPAQVSGSEGLDNLYQGQLDDTLLAFMPFVDPQRASAVGAYARNEHFEQGSGFTVSSLMTARQGWWATRPFTSMKFDIDDTLYRIGQDIWLGSRVSAERKGVVYTDQIMAIKRRGDRDSSGRPMISFGDDSREEDPVAQGFAAIANVAQFASMIAGSGDMF